MAPGPRVTALIGALACLGGLPRPSAADDTPSLALEPAPAGDRGFAVERAGVRGHLLPSARLVVDYANEPLVLINPAGAIDRVVVGQTAFHALAGFSIAHRFAVNLDVPFAFLQAGRAPDSGETAPRPGAAEFGDIRVGARARILGAADEGQGGTAVALAASLWVPTATEGYAGDGAVRARAAILAEGVHPRLYWAASGGVRTRPSAQLPGVVPTRVGTALTLGLSGGFYADSRRDVALGAEFAADLGLGGARFLDPRATVAHLLATGHYRVAGGPFEIGAAFGPGFGQGAGSADFRVLALFGYAPEEPAPPPDRDEDGVPDKEDTCLDLVGVPSPDPLLHGCPEAPPDRDGDAIPDQNDACPTLVGEATGVRATHGCPRRHDADEDGIVDRDDACPKEPGPAPPEGNGCPPRKPPEPPVATLSEQQIEISQQVQFETGTAVLRPESDAVLGQVARILVEHPELELLEVQGHTDDTGPRDLNRRLGQDRADSVVVWLAMHGVARERLSPKGYGADKPLADNGTEEGRTKNRRVEFRILRKKPEAPRQAPKEGGGAR